MTTDTLDQYGNSVVNGYSTNLTPQQFSSANVPVADVAPVAPLNPSIFTPPTVDMAGLNAATTGSLAYLNNSATQADAQYQQYLNDAQATSQQKSSLEALLGGKGADTAQLYESGGVNKLAGQLNSLNAQAVGLNNEAQAIPIANRLAYKGSAGTENQVQNVNYDQLAQNALKALSLGQQAAIAKADYDTAKSLADQQITIKYDQITANITAKQTQLDALDKYKLTPAQEKAKAAQQRVLDKEKEKAEQDKLAEQRAYTEKMDNKKAVDTLLTNAAQVAPASVLAKAKSVVDRGGSPTEVALSLGQYGADYLKNLSYKSQLETDKAQRANIYDQIANRNKELVIKQQEYNDKKTMVNFQAPPIINPVTGKSDPKSVVTSIVKATGGKLKGGQAALDVLSSVQSFADRNSTGKFAGLGATAGFSEGIIGDRLANQTQVSNKQDIEAINLKVQQWASGASLTTQQIEQVDKFTPRKGDSDNQVKAKTNGLVNFMLTQISSDLAGQGISYTPEPVDYFKNISQVDNNTLLNSIPSPSSNTLPVDNATFFKR